MVLNLFPEKRYSGVLTALVIHSAVLFFAFVLLFFLDVVKVKPGNGNLIAWDAGWYNSIREQGYIYKADQQSNVGFFPFFSFLWKFSGLSAVGITVVNVLLFYTGFFFLGREFNITKTEGLLLLSLPSLMFMFVPYTEACFFFFGTFLVLGLFRNQPWLILISIFFCSLVRPTAVFFVPAIVLMELLQQPRQKFNFLGFVGRVILYSLPSFVALMLVILLQWKYTGEWFVYAKAQIEHWDHAFRLPKFPLNTWGDYKLIWLDGMGFWVGAMAAATGLGWLFSWAFGRQAGTIAYPRYLIFSTAYLIGVIGYVFFFHKNDGGSTSMLSLNRYMFTTPFFMVFFLHFLRSPEPTVKWLLGALALTFGVWLLLELRGLDLRKSILYFACLTVYVVLILMLRTHENRNPVWVGIYSLHLFLFLYLYNQFLSGEWVG